MDVLATKCLVCNARNAKQHYGSWCCNGCKGFFWRTISSKRRYICLGNGSNGLLSVVKCEIEDGRRNSCRACRLKRCFDVGMDPNLIRDSWGKSTALKQRNEQPSPSSSSSSDQGEYSMGGEQQQLVTSENAVGQTRVEWKEMARSRTQSNAQNLGPSVCLPSQNLQLLGNYLEWIQTIPELKLFSEQDKNFLILNRARPSGWLILASQLLYQQAHEELGSQKMETLKSEIVGPMSALEVSKLEMELLRLICFFSIVPQMSAEGRRMVQAIQETYTRSLSEFGLKQSLSMDVGTLANLAFRSTRIVHLLAIVEKIAHQHE